MEYGIKTKTMVETIKEYLHKTMDEWDTIFDPPVKCEYSEEQLIRFAEMWAEKQIEELKQ